MSNFYEPNTEFEGRISDFITQLERIDRFVVRGEKRASRAQFEAFLDDLQAYSNELAIPVDTMVVGAQLGFMSGGKVVRGRIPAAIIGAAFGWLYGQHARKDQRIVIDQLVARAAQTAARIEALENQNKER